MKILCPKCRKANHSLSTSLCIHAYLNKVTGIHFLTVCLLISSGDWKYGMRFGEGVLTYTNGAGYRGQWELDKVSALKQRSLRASFPGRPRKKERTLSVFVIDSVKRRLSYRYPWYHIDAADVRLGYHWLLVRLVGLEPTQCSWPYRGRNPRYGGLSQFHLHASGDVRKSLLYQL